MTSVFFSIWTLLSTWRNSIIFSFFQANFVEVLRPISHPDSWNRLLGSREDCRLPAPRLTSSTCPEDSPTAAEIPATPVYSFPGEWARAVYLLLITSPEEPPPPVRRQNTAIPDRGATALPSRTRKTWWGYPRAQMVAEDSDPGCLHWHSKSP